MSPEPRLGRAAVARAAERLVAFAAVGALAGVLVWALKDDPEGPKRFPNIVGSADAGDPTPRIGADEISAPRRDNRPPRAPAVPATPPRLEIPAIKVRAHVSSLGKTKSGELGVPKNWSVVGWWRGGSRPGQRGVSVLVGHVDSRSRPAVFHNLRKLHKGDLIRFVPRSGKPVRFVVAHKQRISKGKFPTERVYGETKEPVLRLITCGGSFDWSRGHYRDNLIVYATKA